MSSVEVPPNGEPRNEPDEAGPPSVVVPDAGPDRQADLDPPTLVRIPDVEDAPVLRVDEARRRSLRRWAVGGATVVVLAVLGIGLTMTPLFHAKTIRVEGARHLSERQVRKLADVDAGTNVFSLDEDAVARRLERSAWVLDAVVSTSLPSTVRIEVTERVPVAVAKTDEGSVTLAADGSVLGPAPAGGLPEIRALEAPAGETTPPVTGAIVSAATSAAAEFGPTLRPVVEAIVVQPDATLTLELRDGVTVTYGGSGDLEAKAEALRAILDYADREGKTLISIDLRSPAAPTARFVGTPVVVSIPAGQTAGQRDGATGESDGAAPAQGDGTSSPAESPRPSP